MNEMIDMGIKETLREKFEGGKAKAKVIEKEAQSYVPKEIREPIERKVKEFEESRKTSAKQKEILNRIRSKAEFTQKKQLAVEQGQERARKGGFFHRMGTAVLRKVESEATSPRSPVKMRSMPKMRSSRPSGTTVVVQPSFAPASMRPSETGEARPFLIVDEQQAGLSQGMQQAFFGEKTPQQKRPTAIERAFFGTASMPSVGKAFGTSAKNRMRRRK